MKKNNYFLKIFKAAEKKYGKNGKRLAAEGWKHDWQTLIAIIYSAQSRDELTITVMKNLFKKFKNLRRFAYAPISDIMKLTKKINYYKTKSKNAKKCATIILEDFKGKIPDSMDELLNLPGVGRKTANLILSEIYKKNRITVDTHVHRISNVLGLVKTKTPYETELALMKISPKKYWSKINRIFVLFGKDTPGKDKKKLLKKLNLKN